MFRLWHELLKLKSEASYKRHLRSAAYAYFKGVTTRVVFLETMRSNIMRAYEQAWREGEALCGFDRAERTKAQQERLQQEIDVDLPYLIDLADWIESKRHDASKWRDLSYRINVWVMRYAAVRTIAQSMTCADKKMVWYLGRAKKHCSDCKSYEGKVYRMSQWVAAGALPQARGLECGGFNCDCRLVPTDARASAGAPHKPHGGKH